MSDETENDAIDREELRDRVIYALLGPAARFARVLETPLTLLRDWAEMAYFHDARKNDMKLKEIADLMDVSMSKVALLSRALKENFTRPDVEAELPRRIEFMLWAEPLSLAKIKQVLTDVSKSDVNDAVQQLLDEGRIVEEEQEHVTVYRLDIKTDRRVWDTWLARIDGLNNVLRNVGDAVFARFFTDEAAAFARTLSFRVKKEDLSELRDFYENELFELVQELDEATDGVDEEETIPLSMSLFWAPYDFLARSTTNVNDEEEET